MVGNGLPGERKATVGFSEQQHGYAITPISDKDSLGRCTTATTWGVICISSTGLHEAYLQATGPVAASADDWISPSTIRTLERRLTVVYLPPRGTHPLDAQAITGGLSCLSSYDSTMALRVSSRCDRLVISHIVSY